MDCYIQNVYIYICMYVITIHMYVYNDVIIYIYIILYMRLYIYMCVLLYMYIYAIMYMYMFIFNYMYMIIYIIYIPGEKKQQKQQKSGPVRNGSYIGEAFRVSFSRNFLVTN